MKAVKVGENLGTSPPNFVSRSLKRWEAIPASFPGPSHRSQGHLHIDDEYWKEDLVNLNPKALFLREIEKKGKRPGIEVGGRCDLGYRCKKNYRWGEERGYASSTSPPFLGNQFLNIMASCQRKLTIHRPINLKLWQETMNLTIQMKALNISFLNCCCGWNPLVRPDSY